MLGQTGILKNNSTAGTWHLKILLNRRRSTFSKMFTSLVDKPYQASTLMRILLMNKEFHTNIHKKRDQSRFLLNPLDLLSFFVLVLVPLVHFISAKYLPRLCWSERSACAALGCWHKRRWPLFWSERSACAALGCWHKRRWPLFWSERVACAGGAT